MYTTYLLSCWFEVLMRLLPLTGLLLIVSALGIALALVLVRADRASQPDALHVNYPRQPAPHLTLHPSYRQAETPSTPAPLTARHGQDEPAALFNQEGNAATYRYPATGRTYVF
ncbi:hypothetical protein [Larsenimonas rhizosphaerae]|uniref:hypothetical protein n=1 Tax=Larsenimonas rhizosphaerae TaxID=2944682 RepID=UPI0020338C78|nr:hypothetical protein [Larsenimonas rhizosphaerae]MCM2131498.1 hypothetical protein [Larsenimonas rhizosphaerae]